MLYISAVSQLFVLTHACGLVLCRLRAGGRAGDRQASHGQPGDFPEAYGAWEEKLGEDQLDFYAFFCLFKIKI